MALLINDTTGEYNNDLTSWQHAIGGDPTLSLLVPANFVDEFRGIILDVLYEDPPLLIKQASREIRRDWNILKEYVRFKENAIGYVQPTTPRYKELCIIAAKDYGEDIVEYIPKELNDANFYLSLAKVNKTCINLVPKEMRTSTFWEIMTSLHHDIIRYVPLDKITSKMCKIAVKKDNIAFAYIPDRFKTPELCKSAVKRSGSALEKVPKEMITQELCNLAVDSNSFALAFVPPEFLNLEIYKIAAKDYEGLSKIPKPARTFEICKVAVETDPRMIYHVPSANMSEDEYLDLCRIALKKSKYTINSIAPAYRDRLKKNLILTINCN